VIPTGLVDGIVQVDNGLGLGNALYLRTIFAPALDLRQAGTGTTIPLQFTFTTGAVQHAMGGFAVEMLNADATLSGFAAGSNVGTITTSGGSRTSFSNPVSIRVISSASDKLVLDVSGNNTQTLTIQKTQGSPVGLTFAYAFKYPYESPVVNAVLCKVEIALTGVPVQVSVGGQATTWGGQVLSTASGFAGPNYFHRISIP
jgi:hypothetical protein